MWFLLLGTFLVCSNFSDIFDVDWFISSVAKDVKVIKEPPEEILSKTTFGVRVPRKAKPIYYLSKILPTLKKREVTSCD
jgi:hypothetical protein